MNFPYAPFRLEHDPRTNEAVCSGKPVPVPDHALANPRSLAQTSRDRNIPMPALGANMAETRGNSMQYTAVKVNPANVVNARSPFQAATIDRSDLVALNNGG
jgi:hypothetical protein